MTTGTDVRFGDLAGFLGRDRAGVEREFLDLVQGHDRTALATRTAAETPRCVRNWFQPP